MKRILIICATLSLMSACSVEEKESTTETRDLTTQINTEFSNRGIYKGVFTTLNAKFRATVEVHIPELGSNNFGSFPSRPTAFVRLNTGELFMAQAVALGEEERSITNIEFHSKDLSFLFSVNNDGTEASFSEVLFKGLEADIIAYKHTERNPVTPMTGTWDCTTCNGHPNVGQGGVQTFNMVFTNAGGDSDITTQSTTNSNVRNGIGVQRFCNSNGNDSFCRIESGDGATTVIGFLANGGNVYWRGSHFFNNEPSANGNDCSGLQGRWLFESQDHGTLRGYFTTDLHCFPESLYEEYFDSFDGSGFAPSPAPGQLDSDIVIATGFSDGSMSYGDTQTAGDFARGLVTNTNVTTGGIYCFDNTADFFMDGRALGLQPAGDDFTPGTFEFRIQNNTGSTLSGFQLMYDLYTDNLNTDRSNSFNFSFSTDGVNFTPIPQLDFISPEISVVTGGFPPSLPELQQRHRPFSASVPNGGFIYLRFSGDDVSGSGGWDQFWLDNIILRGR